VLGATLSSDPEFADPVLARLEVLGLIQPDPVLGESREPFGAVPTLSALGLQLSAALTACEGES